MGQVIDVKGNLYAHRQAGLTLPIRRLTDLGAEIDISEDLLVFRARNFTKPLAPDPENPLGRLLLLEIGDLVNLPLGNSAYAILDTANEGSPPLLDGTITVRGW